MKIYINAENGEEELELNNFCDRYGLNETEVLEVMEKENISVYNAIMFLRPKYYINWLGQLVVSE